MITPTPDPETRDARKLSARRMMKRMALVSLVAAIVAVLLVRWASPDASIHMLLATFIGAGGSFLMGTGLMTLAFYSSSSGHDADAQYSPDTESDSQ